MEITVKGIKVFYERYEGAGVPVLVLHGWGADSSVMRVIYDNLVMRNRSALALDFPYFGKSGAPGRDFTVFDYEETVREFLELLGIGRVIVIGHSFGGRVGIIGAARENTYVDRLILIDSAGCKPKRGLKYRIKVFMYKLKKRLGFRVSGGSKDYLALPDYMKGVFVRIVNTHLEPLMKKIRLPVLLMWGRDDRDTPLYMAKRMNRLIADSGLVTLQNAGHFSFLDRPQETNLIINAFIGVN